MTLALVEWLLLARSDLVLHTFGSSFGEEAAYAGGAPALGLWGELLLLHAHPALPQCAHRLFLRGAKRRRGLEGALYTEGGRSVVGVDLALRPCPPLAVPLSALCFE